MQQSRLEWSLDAGTTAASTRAIWQLIRRRIHTFNLLVRARSMKHNFTLQVLALHTLSLLVLT
jgi:hypothetical protein